MPIRHGMTIGELARLFNGENQIGADLTVVPLKNWQRDDWFDDTGLPWINPSPEHAEPDAGDALSRASARSRATNLSVGRGTDTPFEQVGAPWIDGVEARRRAECAAHVPGIRFYPVRFTPTASKFAGEECQGVFMIVTDRAALRPVRVGVEIAAALSKLYGARSSSSRRPSACSDPRRASRRIRAGEDPASWRPRWAAAEAAGGCCATSICSIADV